MKNFICGVNTTVWGRQYGILNDCMVGLRVEMMMKLCEKYTQRETDTVVASQTPETILLVRRRRRHHHCLHRTQQVRNFMVFGYVNRSLLFCTRSSYSSSYDLRLEFNWRLACLLVERLYSALPRTKQGKRERIFYIVPTPPPPTSTSCRHHHHH